MSIVAAYAALEEVMKRRKRSPKRAAERKREELAQHIKEQTSKKTARTVQQEKECPFLDAT